MYVVLTAGWGYGCCSHEEEDDSSSSCSNHGYEYECSVCILSVSVNGGVSPALMSLISSIAMIGAAAGVTWGGSSTRYSSVEAKTII